MDSKSLTDGGPTAGRGWIFQFRTKDAYYAGYDGQIEPTIHGTSTGGQETKMPAMEHVERGEVVVEFMDFRDRDVATIQLHGTNRNLFNTDHWTVESITAWNLASKKTVLVQ